MADTSSEDNSGSARYSGSSSLNFRIRFSVRRTGYDLFEGQVRIAKLDLPRHDGADILAFDDDGHGDVDDAEMAAVNVRLIGAYRLEAAAGIAFLAVGGQVAVLANSLAKGLAAAVFGDRDALVIDGDDRHSGDEGEGILQLVPFFDIDDSFQVVARVHVASSPNIIHSLRAVQGAAAANLYFERNVACSIILKTRFE